MTAAAAIDPIVERLSNRGWFGPGNFTDHSTRDVVPALCAGLVLFALLLVGFARRAMSSRRAAPSWLRSFALASDAGSLPRLLPAIFALQLTLLWGMETAEQLAVDGRLLGGLIWLGGPMLASLAIHAAGCVAFTWLLARILHWAAATIVRVVTLIRQLCCGLRGAGGTHATFSMDVSAARFLEPVLALPSGRAPPALSV